MGLFGSGMNRSVVEVVGIDVSFSSYEIRLDSTYLYVSSIIFNKNQKTIENPNEGEIILSSLGSSL